MLKPYVGAIIHYIPMSDTELRCRTCDQPRAAIITRIHTDLDVDLFVFTSKALNPGVVRTVVPYALVADKAPHWRWVQDTLHGGVPEQVERDTRSALQPLQDALRSLIPGRGSRDRLLLERWAQALETGSIDDTVLVKDGRYQHVEGYQPKVRSEARLVTTRVSPEDLEEDSETTRMGEQV